MELGKHSKNPRRTRVFFHSSIHYLNYVHHGSTLVEPIRFYDVVPAVFWFRFIFSSDRCLVCLFVCLLFTCNFRQGRIFVGSFRPRRNVGDGRDGAILLSSANRGAIHPTSRKAPHISGPRGSNIKIIFEKKTLQKKTRQVQRKQSATKMEKEWPIIQSLKTL